MLCKTLGVRFLIVVINKMDDPTVMRQRPFRRPYAIDATRVHLTMPRAVSFPISRPFGPRRATDTPRRRQFGGKKFAPLVVDAIAEDKARAVAILQERRLKREEREREMRVLYESSTMV